MNFKAFPIIRNEILLLYSSCVIDRTSTFKPAKSKKEKEMHCLSSNKFGEAVSYALKRWDRFKEFMNCAEMTPDNNLAENAIRPFVLGRKNWLFTGSEEGARSSCFMYTLIENAKLSGLVPYDYLRCLFEQAADLDENSDWSKLLPWNIKITPWKD